GRGSAIADLSGALQHRGLEVERVESLDGLAEQSGQLLRGGHLRAVVAAGGDGTVAEIVNRTLPETPIAVYPLGTENLLAKYLKIELDAAKFARMLADGHT